MLHTGSGVCCFLPLLSGAQYLKWNLTHTTPDAKRGLSKLRCVCFVCCVCVISAGPLCGGLVGAVLLFWRDSPGPGTAHPRVGANRGVGMDPSSPCIPVKPSWNVLLGVHMESVSRKCYVKQFQKRDKHRKMILILSLKQIKSISSVITLLFNKREVNNSSSRLCYKNLALCTPGEHWTAELLHIPGLSKRSSPKPGLPGQRTRNASLTLALTHSEYKWQVETSKPAMTETCPILDRARRWNSTSLGKGLTWCVAQGWQSSLLHVWHQHFCGSSEESF